ncbi:MAG: hypothetical protein K2Q14_04150 [Gammaproteobacteria bacterium]|nr:hypothetical protein [Gammaproteobacteria bacterium]
MNVSLKRLYGLILNDIMLNRRLIFIASITIAIFCIILPFDITNNFIAYYISLFFGGFIITGLIFKDLHNSRKAIPYLMLPCSNFERFLSKWLLSSIGYALISLTAYYLLSLLGSVVNILIFQRNTTWLNIFQPNLWHVIFYYVLYQAFVFLGAIYFKKHALIKTALAAGCYMLLLTIFTRNFYLNSLNLWISSHNIYIAILSVLAVISLMVAYLKLTEYELK